MCMPPRSGGTHPALVEALGVGGVVLAHDESANRETAGDAARISTLASPTRWPAC